MSEMPRAILSWPGLTQPSTNKLKSLAVALDGRIKCGYDNSVDAKLPICSEAR